jgi:hypothetical protein
MQDADDDCNNDDDDGGAVVYICTFARIIHKEEIFFGNNRSFGSFA